MTRNLRDELSALAEQGVERMAPADDLVAVLSVRFAHARRRRPVLVAGTTCLLLATAGAAAAGVGLIRTEVPELPDRVTTGAQAPAAPTGLRCGREVGELQPSVLPMMLRTADPTNVAATTVDVARAFSEGWDLGLSLDNMTTSEMTVTVGDVAGLYLVEDGTVVAQPGPAGPTREQTLERGQGTTVLPDRPVLCSGGEAPDGTYEAYASVEVTVEDGESAGTYDVVGGPWTVELGPPVSAPVTPAGPGIPGLTSVVPGASSPVQCGAEVGWSQVGPVWSAGSDDRWIDTLAGWTGVDDPAGMPVGPDGRATISMRPEVLGGGALGYPTTAPAFVIVTEGVVVGTSSPGGPVQVPATAPVDLDSQVTVAGTVLYRACAGGESDAGPLPAGHYSIWATQGYHLTGRSTVASGGGATVVDEEVAILGRAADLWIGADGLPVLNPGPAAGWPTPLPSGSGSGSGGEERSVAWFAVVDGVADELVLRSLTQDVLAEAGYESVAMPVACQPRAQSVLNLPRASTDATGVGVVFATRAEADAFVGLVDVPGVVVEGEVSCSAS